MAPPERQSSRLTAHDLVEALHLALAARALDRRGVFAALTAKPAETTDLAKQLGLDQQILTGALSYLATRTTLLDETPHGFVSSFHRDVSACFILRLYADAFLPCSTSLPETLEGRTPAPIDETARESAFGVTTTESTSVPAGILHQLGCNRLLDLGCGVGSLLLIMAAADEAFRGWGIEKNPGTCARARSRLKEASVSQRVVILEGDASCLAAAVPIELIDEIDAIFAGDLLNEFMADEGAEAIRILSDIARLFPGRMLVVSDYYGTLTKAAGSDPQILLHDFVQLVSGQGIPPASCAGWNALYLASGWNLVHAINYAHSNRFLHILKAKG
jgi:SAM-dependent methyltransferase